MGLKEGSSVLKKNESPTPICISYQKIRAGKTRGMARHACASARAVGKRSKTPHPHPAVTCLPWGTTGDLLTYCGFVQRLLFLQSQPSPACLGVWKLPALKDAFSPGPLPIAAPSLDITVLLSTRKKNVFFTKSVAPKQTDKPCRNVKVLVKASRKQFSFQQI